MIQIKQFSYQPTDSEQERATNSYLMSLVAFVVGLPLPILNLLATLFFYISNRRGTYFVRWHCTQALLSQISVLPINSIGFWWTISIIFRDATFSNAYFSYMLVVLIFNIIEFSTTIYTAIKVRKGVHVSWWFYGPLTDKICPPNIENEEFSKSKYGW